MAKHDFLTPKAIANRIKAKGLQKLRWFCQVCQKQCRDENGFKCHTTSESHQRQMLLVASDPDKYLSGFSEMFEQDFLENLRRRHGTKRMRANVVYNEFIADKLHIHMNATQWTTLGSFVQYLGRTGKCVVDETEKGWYIQYIDRDPRTLARQEELAKKKQADLDHEEQNRAFMERQLQLAKEAAKDQDGIAPAKASAPLALGADGKMSLALKQSRPKERALLPSASAFATSKTEGAASEQHATKARGRAVDAIMEENERSKQQRKRKREEDERQPHWVAKGIVVKVMNKRVGGGKYYKLKGEVTAVKDLFGAQVEMLDSGDILQLDQDDLETVIPKPCGQVHIVNGPGRGQRATLLSISVEDFCAQVRIESGARRGEVLDRVEYEDICKIAQNESEGKERRA